MELGAHHLTMRLEISISCCFAKSIQQHAEDQVWTSRLWLWMLMRMPIPMKSVSSAVPP